MVHEWALAEAVLESILNIASENKLRRIHKGILTIGSLQNIDIEIFKESLDIIGDNYPIKIDEISFEHEDAGFKCNRCGYEWNIDDLRLDEDIKEAIHFLPEALYAFIRCPRCRSTDFKVTRGRGIYIKRIEGVK